MSCAHRGDWKKHPENSFEGIQSAINAGIDAVEVDIQQTKDGKFILMHDETLNRTTNAEEIYPNGMDGSFCVSDWTFEQIQDLRLKQGLGGITAAVTEYRVPTLEEVMKLCRGKILINLDMSWNYRTQVWNIALAMDSTGNCIFKTAIENTTNINNFLDSAEVNSGKRPVFMRMLCWSIQDALNYADGCYTALNKLPVMVEMSLDNYNDNFDETLLAKIGNNMGIFGNALYTGIDDITNWKKMRDAGFNMIMTDDIPGLTSYINSLYK